MTPEQWDNESARRLIHIIEVDVTKPLPFKSKNGHLDAIFPDELELMQDVCRESVVEDMERRNQGAIAIKIFESYGKKQE